MGLPVLPRSSCAHIPPPLPRWNPRVPSSLASPTISAFPVLWPGRLPHQPFRGLLSVRYRCSLRARQITQSDPLHRRLRSLRCLRDRSDCYRLERKLPGGPTPTEGPRLSTAHHKYGTTTGFPRHSPIETRGKIKAYMVAREGIEPPTRGFSVLGPNQFKSLMRREFQRRHCGIIQRDTKT